MRIALGGVAALVALTGAAWWLSAEQCRASLWGHPGGATCVAAADGRFVTGGVDRRVVLWSGVRREGANEVAARAEAVACGPGGETAVGLSDGTLRIGDAAPAKAHRDGVYSLAFGGGLLYSGGNDRLIRAWDPATGKERFVLRGHTGRVRALAVSPDGRWLASGGSGDNRVRLWPVGKAAPPRVLSGAGRRVHCLTFAEGGAALAAGDREGKVHVWDVESGRERATWSAHEGPVNGLALAGEWLVSAGEDGALLGWALSGERRWSRRNRAATNALAAGPGLVISADADGRVRVWDAP